MDNTIIQLADGHNLWCLNLEDLVYAESDRNYTDFHLINGNTKTIIISLKKVIEEIDNVFSHDVLNFKRVGRSYLINLNYINYIDRKNKNIILCNNEKTELHCSDEALRELRITLDNRKKAKVLKQIRFRYEIDASDVYDLSNETLEIDGVDCVDLGLPSGRKWATENLEAPLGRIPEMFAWGETTPKRICTEKNYRFGKMNGLSKYNKNDRLTQLLPEDDAATVLYGDKWRTPTEKDFQELKDHCKWQWCRWDIYNGCLITGSNGNSIFLHAGGLNTTGMGIAAEHQCNYWTSTRYEDDEAYAYACSFCEGLDEDEDITFIHDAEERYFGFYIRPVTD